MVLIQAGVVVMLLATGAAKPPAAAKKGHPTKEAVKVAPPELPVPPGVDLAVMDPKTEPCNDFFRHACGGWLDTTEIPADRPAWTRGFMQVQEKNEKVLHEILEDAAAGKAPAGTPYATELGAFYQSCMDEGDMEGGKVSLAAQWAAVAKVKDVKGLPLLLAQLHNRGVFAFFMLASNVDAKDSTRVIAEADQAGLGLPDRDYYTKTDDKSVEIRKNYVEHVEKMLTLAGQKPELAKKNAGLVMALETQLAQAALTKVERRDPQRVYHFTDVAALKKLAPSLDWAAYFKARNLDLKGLNLTHPAFFEKVGALLKGIKADQLLAYLDWHVVHGLAAYLPKAFVEEDYLFQSHNLTGAKEDRPRWKKCVSYVDRFLGEALAVPFVDKTFGEEGKATTREMVVNLEKAFEANLAGLDWMDAPTKEKALLKIKTTLNKVGYPDTWKKYDGLKLERGNFAANAVQVTEYEVKRDLAKVGKPVDKVEWQMTPPTVNAYSNPQWNEIVFPAGILQPPFFSKDATMAVNYGAIGMVVGHEVTHGFDDEGRQFDASGNLKDWWTEASAKAFNTRTQCVKDQFDGYTAMDDIKVNGALTLGENTADLGGLKLSMLALQAATAGKEDAAKYRYTPAQQFFYGYAQSWCSKYRDEFARTKAKVDPHSPPRWRVNGPLSNLPAFKDAFHCKEDAPMVRPQAARCEVW